MLNVVGRAATVQAVAIGAFVHLGQGTFEETAGHADQGSDPHPEHRARAAQGHGNADPGDVTGAHAASQAQHQGLEGAQLACLATQRFLEHGEHVAEMAELYEPRTDGEVTAETDDQHDEEFPRKEIVECFEHWKMTSILILRME